MKVLVTGHRGYIGVEMVPALLAAGHEVIGLDTGLYDGCDFVSPPDDVPELRIDLRDVELDHLVGCDAVVHLGALSNDPLGNLDSTLTYDINLHASVRLAEAAKEAGVSRYLFSSSCSLYGAGGDGLVTEQSPFHPVTAYGESKVRVEQAVSTLADDTFSPVYLRNATAYGISRRLRADIVVNDLVGHAVTSGKVLMQSDGTPWRPLVHIGDIIGAFVACLSAPREAIHNQAFNVGRNGENYQIRDVARLVADVVPGCEVAFASGASSDERDYRVDFTKIEKGLPGFVARWTLRAGIEEIYHAYVAAGLSAEDWSGDRYYRLRTINSLKQQGILDGQLRFVG
ncbi:NAD-dependent epimerase/dehydratase family protein [Desertimonas flava]|uniref:NAD-dependent epimerase/dehydratase family protein n=1 Tax=Desertimonas flava TaxID=2064846 RepID=UPI000E34D5AB|nr:SDR family oxidoreductase [Desertimonas flava]